MNILDELRRYIAERSRPTSNGCIEWQGARDQDGYGRTGSRKD